VELTVTADRGNTLELGSWTDGYLPCDKVHRDRKPGKSYYWTLPNDRRVRIETPTGAFRGQIITAFIPGDYLWSTGAVCAQDITAFITAFVPHDPKLSEERTNAAKERDNAQHRQTAPEAAPAEDQADDAEDQADDADSNAPLTLAAMREQLAKAKAARTKGKEQGKTKKEENQRGERKGQCPTPANGS
jgi:hypothetical protein